MSVLDKRVEELEKVKQGIKACWSEHWCHKCFHCPYKPDRDNDDTCVERLGADALELLKEQQSISVDMFIKWCVDSQIMGEATRNGLKYWVDKFKEWKSLKDGDGE